MLASRSAGVESRGAVLGAQPPQAPPQPHPHPQPPLHVPIHMPQLGAPFIPTHHPLLQYDSLVRPVAAHRYEQSSVDAADAAAAVATDRLFRQSYFSRMRSEYEATAMFSPPDMHLWMPTTLPPPPAPPPHQTSLSSATSHATHGVLRHPQARTSPPTSTPSTRTPPGTVQHSTSSHRENRHLLDNRSSRFYTNSGARDSPAPVNLSAPHKAAQAGFTYPMLGTTSLYAPSYAHPSMVGRTAAATTATYSPPAASPAPIPAVMPLGPPSAPPRRRMVAMSTASTANLPPPSAPPPSAPVPIPTSAHNTLSSAPTPVSASSVPSSPTVKTEPNHNQVVSAIPPSVTKDLACFKRGARIRLASGEVRSVESMRAEDLVTSADPTLQSFAATVVKLTPKPGGTIGVGMSLQRTGENGLQFESEIEVNQEHPFFVYNQGWTSYNPQRSLQLLGLKCHRLQVGDVCISLARRTPSTPSQSTTGPSRSSGTRTNKKSTQVAAPASIPQTSSAAADEGSSANSSRKRRWSAPDQLEEETKTLKTSH